VVRAQAERAQTVVAHGAYAIVRHPMYAGLLGVMVGQALWLRSTAAVVAVAGPGAVLAVRIVIEERVLRHALPEYAAYVARVRWRLIPGVW
jgi:protein-S-isoprenylcysteine O-methyltransferase Ste14